MTPARGRRHWAGEGAPSEARATADNPKPVFCGSLRVPRYPPPAGTSPVRGAPGARAQARFPAQSFPTRWHRDPSRSSPGSWRARLLLRSTARSQHGTRCPRLWLRPPQLRDTLCCRTVSAARPLARATLQPAARSPPTRARRAAMMRGRSGARYRSHALAASAGEAPRCKG